MAANSEGDREIRVAGTNGSKVRIAATATSAGSTCQAPDYAKWHGTSSAMASASSNFRAKGISSP
jgi:hypothetical protein